MCTTHTRFRGLGENATSQCLCSERAESMFWMHRIKYTITIDFNRLHLVLWLLECRPTRWLALSGGTELALPSGLRGDHGGRQPPAPPTASWGAPGACGQAAEGTDPLQPGSLCQTGPGRGPLRNKAAGGPWALRVPLCEAQCGLGEWEMRQALEPGGPRPVTARAHTLPTSPRGRRRTSLMSWYCPSRA